MPDDMSNLNRRSDDANDGTSPVLAAVDSTLAKFVARMITPALLAALIGVLVWVGKGGMARLDRVVEDQASMRTDMRVLSMRFDEVGLSQIKSNTGRIQRIEMENITRDRRLDTLEIRSEKP